MDTLNLQVYVPHVILNALSVKRLLQIVVPVQQMELIKLFWTEALVLMNYLAQLVRMVNLPLMCVRLVIQAVLHAKETKTTVLAVRGIYHFYQIFAT